MTYAIIAIATLVAYFVAGKLSIKKVGGLYHWRIGRLGGSFYWKRAPRKAHRVRKSIVGFGVDLYRQTIKDLEDAERAAFQTRMMFAVRQAY